MMKTVMLLAAGAVGLHAQTAPDITGDWQGALKAGGAELKIVLHVTKAADGKLKANFDSVNQGAMAIPIEEITVADGKMKFSSAAIHGTYEGKLDAAGAKIDGTWSQGMDLPLVLTRAAVQKVAPSDIDGAWLGTLDMGAQKLRLIFRFTNTADGLVAVAESPDQGAKGIPVSSVKRTGDSLKVDIQVVGAAFDGKIAADKSKIEGTFTQGGGEIPLVLKPMKDESVAAHKRPQNPSKPYPYREEEVSYRNDSAGITLAATLTLPQGKGPFPAVVLITGSGPQDRDESLLEHKPFLVLADHLTRKGIAVLRADDRGVAKSGGDFAKATSADFATDAEAGLAFLKTRPEIDTRKLGLIGHSEGGLIAPMVAARNTNVAFIVMMAGTGVSGAEILPAQVAAIAEASGEGHEKAEKQGAQIREILALIAHGTDEETLLKKAVELSPESKPEQLKAQVKQFTSPWFRYFMSYDPAPTLRQVKCPVLALNGEKDMQVLPAQNLPPIRKALAANKQAEIQQIPSLNHLFQTAKTGAPGEYVQIEETIAPVALNRISSWILAR